MRKKELTALLTELDEELAREFPGPEPIQVLVVGGACLLLAGVTERPTHDVDVIITDLFGTGEASLVYNLSKTTKKVRTIISRIGRKHGFRGNDAMFLNDDCASFLLELGDLPPTRPLVLYQKLHLFIPQDLAYILACKLIAGRPGKDFPDIAMLRQLLGVENRAQAQRIVDRYFPNPALQRVYSLPRTLDTLFEGE
jgi:hypothetical protein